MPTSKFNLGQDTRLVLIGATGRLDLQIVTDFRAQQTVKTVHSDPLNSPPLEAHLPGGWTFSFTIDRATALVDKYVAAFELAYWAGNVITFGQLYQYITEVDGSTTKFQYNTIAFHLSDSGSWMQNAVVKQTLSGFASTRYQI